MMYLVGQLAGWLLLTAAFAALAGWGFAAQRAAPVEAALRRDRTRLADDLAALVAGDPSPGAGDAAEREIDAVRRLNDINIGRIAELERLLAGARASADEHASRAAELDRELQRRAAESETRAPAAVVDVEATPAEESEPDAVALQGWRLRYFEQRVRYLESLGMPMRAPATVSVGEPVAQPPPPEPALPEWRARVAEARADYLEDALRAVAAPRASETAVAEIPAPPESPFAANVNVDMLLRWRMLYLERRAAHLQRELDATRTDEQGAPAPAAVVDAAPDPDRWKWRARYLEARVRHFEQRLAQPVVASAPTAAVADMDESPPPSDAPLIAPEKPPGMPAPRDGAPDDLRLIEGVSGLRQSSLNALGIWHFEQIAVWTPAHVAWIDRYLRLRGGITENEWIEQAADLAREGPAAARRLGQDA